MALHLIEGGALFSRELFFCILHGNADNKETIKYFSVSATSEDTLAHHLCYC